MVKQREEARQARPAAAGARLLIIDSDAQKPATFVLGAQTSIGSALENDLTLRDGTVSRRHALLKHTGGGYQLVDLESTNGTFVNGRRIRGAATLRNGDQIRLGARELRFIASEASASRLAVPSARKLIIGGLALVVLGFAATGGVLWYQAAKGTSAPKELARTARMLSRHERAAASAAVSTAGTVAKVPSETAPVAATAGWLRRLNYYRGLVGEAAVVESPELSEADRRHAKYLVMNFSNVIRGGTMGAFAHREDAGKPGYSPEGMRAAARSDVYFGDGAITPEELIEGWISGPFHRLPMLLPNLRSAGFGFYHDAGVWAAAIFLSVPGDGVHLYQRPVEFPPDGSTLDLVAVRGEWPDPLASCPGYEFPAGLAVSLQLGHLVTPRLSAHSITADGQPLDHCAFDATSYSNPDPIAQRTGREVLTSYGAVILIPRRPLKPGVLYRVSLTAGDRPYAWSFRVSRSDR